MIHYSRLVPANSFLGRYLKYMQAQETAEIFDFYCGLWAISAVCGRATYVARPRARVYLNMFVILVGESGVARKTTSVHMATRIVRTALGHNNAIGMMDGKVTPEKMLAMLQDRTMEFDSAQLCISIAELAAFMGRERYLAHMPTLLTDLYDSPEHYVGGGTLARGKVMLHDVWLHFISASTPIWLVKTVNPNVIEGGFTSRCFFVISNQPKQRIPWPEDNDADMFQDLCDDAKIIAAEAAVRGPISVDPVAIQAFADWYHARGRSVDAFKQSFEAREDAHALRIAAVLCINDGSWHIKRSHVRVAIRLVEDMKERSSGIFLSTELRTKFAHALDAIRAALMSYGMDPVPRHKLYLKARQHITNEEFLTLLEIMHEIGAIQRFSIAGERGRPADWIRGTDLLLAKGLGESVLERFS